MNWLLNLYRSLLHRNLNQILIDYSRLGVWMRLEAAVHSLVIIVISHICSFQGVLDQFSKDNVVHKFPNVLVKIVS